MNKITKIAMLFFSVTIITNFSCSDKSPTSTDDIIKTNQDLQYVGIWEGETSQTISDNEIVVQITKINDKAIIEKVEFKSYHGVEITSTPNGMSATARWANVRISASTLKDTVEVKNGKFFITFYNTNDAIELDGTFHSADSLAGNYSVVVPGWQKNTGTYSAKK